MNKEQLLKLLENDRLKEVLDELAKQAREGKHYLHDDIILLSGRQSSIRRDQNRGLITYAQAGTEQNKIRHSIQILIEEFFESTNSKRTILFLGASPKDLDVLRINEEIQRIKDGLDAATYRHQFAFVTEPAVQISTITKAMQEYSPAIVHFSGHGSGEDGISVESESGEEVLFPNAGLDRLFRITTEHVECVILNACYASVQAEIISRHGIYVIGMNNSIEDTASIKFAIGFYQSLGEGKDYEYAFDIAMINISSFLDSADIPELWKDGKLIGR